MKQYLIINTSNDDIEYRIRVISDSIGTSYMMYRSKSVVWSEHVRETLVLSITDDGNGFKVEPKLGKKLDYDVFTELYLLMSFIVKEEPNLYPKYMVVTEVNETT